MLYQRLLSSLLTPHFSFKPIWEHLGLDAFAPLSEAFLAQTRLIASVGDVDVGFPHCLDDLTDVFRTMCDALNVACVDDELEIVYRAQQQRLRSPARAEREDLQRALEQSLREVASADATAPHFASPSTSVYGTSGMGVGIDSVMPPFGGATLKTSDGGRHLEDTNDSEWTMINGLNEEATVPQEDKTSNKGINDHPVVNHNSASPTPATKDQRERSSTPFEAEPETDEEEPLHIIGRTHFTMDDDHLDAYLARILEWWRGEREPEGVEIEHSRRCFSCEYREGCEWREKKAMEHFERLRSKETRTEDSLAY